MKKLLYIVMIVLLGGVNNTVSAGVEGEIMNKNYKPLARVKIDFSTRNLPDGGECEGSKGFCLIIGINPTGTVDNMVGVNGTGEIYLDGKNQLILNILKDEGGQVDDPNVFHVYKSFELSQEVASLLGVSNCVIKKGDYKISFSQFEHGTVRLNVITE
jgi:hypothetical protein